ncbi:hypothetical protein SAMN05216480_10529 [Pustulibacterium marinum]|uniref:Uncharacterized protein n=1 Tax=Pustulibacterium marinum TaxID=1224947 RepID=A0A1I7GKG9_9FLAO|nr:hypothetical protein [Pustulibacterium marinum]SFU48933.1 hypothetical protein SAMN05216480_10529 [Pustulibacterium marinum]
MKFSALKRLQTTMVALASLLNLDAKKDDVPIDAQKKELALDEDQMAVLHGEYGEEDSTKMINAINQEIKAAMTENLEFKAIQDEIDAMIKENNLNAEEIKGSGGEGKKGDQTDYSAQIKALNEKYKAQNDLLQKLINDPEGDTPEAIIKGMGQKIQHSATHVFGGNEEWNKIEGRSWNQRLVNGAVKATDFNADSNIPLLQDDVAHFVRENPEYLESLFSDYEELPSEWSRKTGVLDRVANGYIIPGEIVQGRKKGWSPKNNFKIGAEEGRVFRKKIDITFDGYELQEMETTWIRSYNKEGSSPLKMTFIGHLLAELVKQQMLDDRKAQINGLYAKTPDGDDMPGKAVNSQNGLRYLFWYYRDVKKQYRASDIGVPSDSNIVDYVEELVLSVPEDDRNKELELGISEYWLKKYRKKAGQLYNLQMDTEEGRTEYKKNHVVNYPNIKFQPLKDMTRTDFMYITQSKNIQIMDYNTNEKGKFTITHDGKRNVNIFADYRLGIRLIYVGVKTKAGDPKEFEKQMVWSNSVPIFAKDITLPLFDDETGELEFTYNSMKVDDAWKTDITDVTDAVPGQVVRISGNTSLSVSKNVVATGNITLSDGSFDLKSGGTLTLYVNEDKTLTELTRTTEPATKTTGSIEYTTAVLDADLGTVYKFTGDATTAITSITNGVESKTITIYGTDTADVDVTLSTTGNISLTEAATLASSEDLIKLTLVDGIWMETGRTIAPAA